jgi:DNA-binding cell septation regulator SpoVG
MAQTSGSCLAYVSVELPSGLVLNDLRLMKKADGFWIGMPSRKQVNRDGMDRLNRDGKPIYSQDVEFRDRLTSDRFRDAILDLVRREHPGVLQ